MNREDPSSNQQKTLKRGPQMKKKYTIGVMIGNAISPHIVELIEGIYRASADMQIDVFFFLGIHSGYYYKLNKESAVDKDFDYQFNVIYDYQAFAGIDALIIEYGSLSLFLDKKEQKEFLKNSMIFQKSFWKTDIPILTPPRSSAIITMACIRSQNTL